jgi:hypothetical protein
MKISNTIFSVLALVITVTVGAGTAQAGALQVPHNKQDRVIVYTKKTPYAHPIDYWWHLNPSSSGSWDYFSPVHTVSQPMPLERGTVSTYGTPTPSVRDKVRKAFSRQMVYGNPAATGTPPAYQQGHY